MQRVIRELEQVRRVGRALLLVQRLMQWTAALAGMLLIGGLVDFALRLPGWLRLVLGLATVVVALVWLVRRLKLAAGFGPHLSMLALRAERLYPQLAGVLASGVEFAANRDDYAQPKRTGAMSAASIDSARQQLAGVNLRRLINARPTLRIAGVFALAAVVSGSVAVAAPAASWLAVQRWAFPLGEAQWPRRTEIRSRVTHQFWPDDTPLALQAQVRRGYRQGMRAWVSYRLIDAQGRTGSAQRQLMTEQAEGDGVFARPIDFDVESAAAGSAVAPRWSAIEFRFEAGDDWTQWQAVKLAPRPAVERVTVAIEPPTYARGLVAAQQLVLDDKRQSAGLVSAPPGLIGSQVALRFELNNANVIIDDQWQQVLAGFWSPPSAQQPATEFTFADRTIEARFTLRHSLQTGVTLTDEHGLTNMSERIYRIEAVQDNAPSASIVTPSSDEAVLATAVIELEAAGRDDVGLEQLALSAEASKYDEDAREPAPSAPEQLNRVTGRRRELTVGHRLALAGMKLRPGDSVQVTAEARDVFDLDGKRHDPVRSAPRTLRIIDESTLVNQIRTELAGIRQQAIRLETRQRRLMEMPAATASPRQRTMGRRLATQQTLAQSLQQRMDRNNLDAQQGAALGELLDRVGEYLDQAQSASQAAADDLEQSRADPQRVEQLAERARSEQQQVTEALSRLAQLLDQGSDMLTLQLKLQKMLTQQRQLAEQTRQMLPRTLGQTAKQVSPQDRKQLDELKDQQTSLSEKANQLVSQMASTAEVLSRQGQEAQDQASAQALAEAAGIAQRQGLELNMQKAAKQMQQNRLASAGQQQQQAMDVMEQMLDQMKDRQHLKQEILRRQLLQLAEAIRKLIGQQEAHLKWLETARRLPALAEPMSRLWSNTQAVESQAQSVAQTRSAGQRLGEAAEQQSSAVEALRAGEPKNARTTEQAALAKLREALRLVEQTRSDLDQQQARQ